MIRTSSVKDFPTKLIFVGLYNQNMEQKILFNFIVI